MLYVSTRNASDTFTAHRALQQDHSPDGGFYVPFHMPAFSSKDLNTLKAQATAETVSQMLNLFFGLHLSRSEVESAVGDLAFRLQKTNQNFLMAEIWHTLDGSFDYVVKRLYNLMTGRSEMPAGWPFIAIEISVMFGLYSAISKEMKSFDIALPVADFASLNAVLYAKRMGLPVNRVICACDENDIVWDMTNNGAFSTNFSLDNITYLELLIYQFAGVQGVKQYLDAFNSREIYRIEEEILLYLKDNLYSTVVSAERAESIISGMYRSNQYNIDLGTAYAYGSLQDYRASTGANNQTVIFAKICPERIKE